MQETARYADNGKSNIQSIHGGDMQIVEKKVSELKAYEKNPRKNDKAVARGGKY